jgi:chromosomal replication initiator protein
MTEHEIWQTVLNDIESQVSKAQFVTWFQNTYITSQKDGVVSIAVPNAFSREWLENRYNKQIMHSLRNMSQEIKEVRYIIENKKTTMFAAQTAQSRSKDLEEAQLQFEVLQVDKKTNLNPKYTLDNYVVGPSNELAHAAAVSVAQKPGILYNPLFVYGGVGLGKTHLLQAIGNVFTSQNKKVIYLTSERFTSEFISSIPNQDVESFRNKYRNKDVLIIDDIQFIAGKEQTQEEFFHTFNTLHEQNRQIILSSDRTPRSIPTLEERLRSRFEGGMLVDIGYPNYETRVAILKSKLLNKNASLSEDVINYIANNIQKNVRELEGALNLVVASSKLYKNEINLEQAKKILTHITSRPKKNVSYKKLFQVVADFYEINEKDIIGPNRKREYVLPRQIAMYLMRKELKASYPSIGEKFGGKDHTTIIYACKKIDKEINNNTELEEELNLIKQQLYVE